MGRLGAAGVGVTRRQNKTETNGPRLTELTKGQCRFPVGPDEGRFQRFCGGPCADGESYCLACRAQAYLPGSAMSDAEAAAWLAAAAR